MKKLWERVCGHPIITAFVAIVVTLTCAHFWSNWQSERRWERYCEAARARGVKLTIAEITPPPVPDAENFASLPMWRTVFDDSVPRPMELPSIRGFTPRSGDPVKGTPLDWIAWQKYFKEAGYIAEISDVPARDVLLGLEHFAPQFQQWSEWRTRPLCRFPLDYKAGFGMPLPHLGTFQNAARLFALRMRAHLALGDSAAAYADFREGCQAHRMLEGQPTIISGLIQISVLAILWNGLGDGLKNHRWAEPELRQIQADVATINPWLGWQGALSSERAIFNSFYDQLATASPLGRANVIAGLSTLRGDSGPKGQGLGVLLPKRVFRDNQLRHNQYIDELVAQVDAVGFHPERPAPPGPGDQSGSYYYLLFRIAAPVYAEALGRWVHTQTKLGLAQIAIALERHRLARGAFPETLDALAPEWIDSIPLDAASRKPLIYRIRDEGKTYLLYGVGPNQTDDGGTTIDPGKSEGSQIDDVWLHAPVASAAP